MVIAQPYENYILRGGPICGVDLRVKNGVPSEIFGCHTQKGSSVVHSPYDISHMLNVRENSSPIVTKICFRCFGLLQKPSSVNN